MFRWPLATVPVHTGFNACRTNFMSSFMISTRHLSLSLPFALLLLYSSMVRFCHETGLLAEQQEGTEKEERRKQTLARMIAVLQAILKVRIVEDALSSPLVILGTPSITDEMFNTKCGKTALEMG